MMELRPIQAALLAGRSASRRATATPSSLPYPLIPSFYRCFSSTRPTFSEAEATAPPPPPSMQEWNRQQQQRQQQQQQQQQSQQSGPPQSRTWGNLGGTSGPNATGGIASLLNPNNSTSLSPPTPAPSTDLHRNPWAKPSSNALRRAQANRAGILQNLGDLNLKDLNLAPTSDDLNSYLEVQTESAAEVKYRLRPSIGRTVNLGDNVDLARGLGILNLRVRKNNVSRDLAKQRYHERPGLKRKRLRSERWRARFKDGFKATCKRVGDLARQGW